MRIAIADDDPTVIEYLSSILTAAGHICLAHNDGAKIVRQLQRDTFDLVILDWSMPGMTGFEVLSWIKENLAVPPAVIMLTSRADKDDIASALLAGADDYIVKPEAAAVISARVEAVMRRIANPAGGQPQMDFGKYRFDRLSGSVRFDDVEVVLTAKEFSLALMFFQNLQRALSRAYILETLWNSVADLPTRTLDMHVSRIRSKLQLRPENGYRLFTIFGYGYRLETGVDFE